MKTYILLIIDNSVHQLAYSPAYFDFMKINVMVIITNEIHYIYKYENLKYDLCIDSSLTATRY